MFCKFNGTVGACAKLAFKLPVHSTRVCHGYGKTRGFRVTGFAGMGTVLNLAYPCITAYPCHGITGMLRVYYHRLRIILLSFLSYLVVFFQ